MNAVAMRTTAVDTARNTECLQRVAASERYANITIHVWSGVLCAHAGAADQKRAGARAGASLAGYAVHDRYVALVGSQMGVDLLENDAQLCQ